MTTKRPAPLEDPAATDPVARARAEVERLHQIERSWSAMLRAKQRELIALEQSAGEDVLAAITSGDEQSTIAAVSARAVALRAEARAVDQTVTAARKQRQASIPLIWKAEAEVIRAQAAPLEAEAAVIGARRDELLAQLKEVEGVEFSIPSQALLAQAALAAPGFSPTYYAPRSERLLNRARALRDQADRIQAAPVVMAGGTPELADLNALIDATSSDPMVIGPRVSAVVEWFDRVTEKLQPELDRRERQTGRERARLVFAIAWRDGALDLPNCRADIAGLGSAVSAKQRNALDDTLEDPTERVTVRA